MARNYWLDLFTTETWQEFRDHGSDVSGFSEARWATVQKMKSGDLLLCYLTRASRWVGILEVIGEPFYDTKQIWTSQPFPSRVPVRPVIELDPEIGVPVLDMRDELTVFQNLGNPNRWSGPFRKSPARWKTADGEAIVRRLEEAQQHPTKRPLKQLKKDSKPLSTVLTEDGSVTVPEDEEQEPPPPKEASVHTEMQYLLLRLGSDMNFDVYVAQNDQNKEWQGHKFSDLPRRRDSLPNQFDPATNKVVKLIDVLWLDGNAIIAAFEVESTTSIYSGLLRMSDLLSMQPNISVPLFLLAPEDWRTRVIAQVNRPTFARMKQPLVEVCRYISFEGLREALAASKAFVKYLKPDYLQEISESCAPD